MSSTLDGQASPPPPARRRDAAAARGSRRPPWSPAAAPRPSGACARAPGCSPRPRCGGSTRTWSGTAQLPAEDRSWVGLIAQAGITAFVTWFAEPTRPPHGVGDIFATAPPELTRSISLQHTLQLVRVVVDVVETNSDRLAAPGDEREVREAVLRYSREVAFSAAEVYARAAEMRGAWDARLEALVVDALVRGDADDALRSRIAALGWSGRGSTLVMVGTTTSALDDVRAAELRRATRRAADDALVGIQGDRLVVFLGGEGDLRAAASTLLPRFGPGPVVIGPGRRRPDRLRPVRPCRALRAARRARLGAGSASGAGRRAAARARAHRRRDGPPDARRAGVRPPRRQPGLAAARRSRPTSARAGRSRPRRARSTCTPTRSGTACDASPT